MSAKRLSRKQRELLAGMEYTPVEEHDAAPVAAVEAQPAQNETQPVAADCVSEAEASKTVQQNNSTTLAACQARIAAAAVEKARGLLRDLAEARCKQAADVEQKNAAVAAAKRRVEQVRNTLAGVKQAAEEKAAAIRQAADQTVAEAIAVLGDQADEVLDQIQTALEDTLAAVEAELEDALAAVEAELACAEGELEAARDEHAVARELGQALVRDIEEQLAALAAASPTAAQVIEESRKVTGLVAQADAFIEARVRNARDLERLIRQLVPYACDYPDAASAIAGLQNYARAWYVEQVRAEIQALEPGKDFEKRLCAIEVQAEEAGVLEFVQADIARARRRDRKALAEKGRAAWLFARQVAQAAQPGDVIAYRAGRVTVYRPLDGSGKFRVNAVYTYNGKWAEDGSSAVGRVVSKSKLGHRRIVVSGQQ